MGLEVTVKLAGPGTLASGWMGVHRVKIKLGRRAVRSSVVQPLILARTLSQL